MFLERFAKGKLQKGLRDDVFIFQAFYCRYAMGQMWGSGAGFAYIDRKHLYKKQE